LKTLSVFGQSSSWPFNRNSICPRSSGRSVDFPCCPTQADTKAYIDFEAGEGERLRARDLYERLLERTSHVKVYISWALMEIAVLGGGEDEDGNEIEGEEGDPNAAREVFERGYKDLRKRSEKEDVSWDARKSDCRLTFSVHCCWKLGRLSRSSMARKRSWPRCRK